MSALAHLTGYTSYICCRHSGRPTNKANRSANGYMTMTIRREELANESKEDLLPLALSPNVSSANYSPFMMLLTVNLVTDGCYP